MNKRRPKTLGHRLPDVALQKIESSRAAHTATRSVLPLSLYPSTYLCLAFVVTVGKTRQPTTALRCGPNRSLTGSQQSMIPFVAGRRGGGGGLHKESPQKYDGPYYYNVRHHRPPPAVSTGPQNNHLHEQDTFILLCA